MECCSPARLVPTFVGVAITAVAVLHPSGETYAAWTSSANQTEEPLAMARLSALRFQDAHDVASPRATRGVDTGQGGVGPSSFGYGIKPTSFYFSRVGTTGDMGSFLNAGGSGTFLRWGSGSQCDSPSLPTTGGNQSGTTAYKPAAGTSTPWQGVITKSDGTSSVAAPVPAGSTDTGCLQVANGTWTAAQRIANSGGQVYQVSTSYTTVQPGAGTFFTAGTDLTAATGHPAQDTPNVWTTTYGVPLPGAVYDPAVVCKAYNGNFAIFWGWPTLAYTTTSDPGVTGTAAPAITAGEWRVYARPKGNADYTNNPWVALSTYGMNATGDARSGRFYGIGSSSGRYTAPGWYEVIAVVYPFKNGTKADTTRYAVSSSVMNVYSTTSSASWCATDTAAGHAPTGMPAVSPNTTPAGHPFAPGAHGFTDASGTNIDAAMSTAP